MSISDAIAKFSNENEREKFWEQNDCYFHKKSGKFIVLKKLGIVGRSLWKMKKTMDVNPNCMNRMALFITLSVDNEHKDKILNLSDHTAKFLNRVNTMLRMRAKRSKKKFYKPIWVWRIEYGKKNGNPHVHFMTNYHYLNYKRKFRFKNDKTHAKISLYEWVKRVWRIGGINKFEKLYDSDGRLSEKAKKKVKNYLVKYFRKEPGSVLNLEKKWDKRVLKFKNLTNRFKASFRLWQIKMNRKICYTRLWGTTREFVYQYVSTYKFSHPIDMERKYNQGILEWVPPELIKIDFNPLLHRRLRKKVNKKEGIWKTLHKNFKGSKKQKQELYVWANSFLKFP